MIGFFSPSLIAAQECLPNNEKRDAFAADYSALARLWEALSPDPCLNPHEADFKWLTQVYESVSGWKSSSPAPAVADKSVATVDDADGGTVDLEQLARDGIAKLIIAKFKGHGLARLVEAILKAQGYTTHLSPPGADKGVDILAAPDALGFGKPRLCVQVKSEQAPIERAVLDQLIGTMQNFHAEQGLLVSWGGFKQSVEKERAAQFFRVRLWDQQTLIEELVTHYDRLDEDLRAELPLKRIWTVAADEEDE